MTFKSGASAPLFFDDKHEVSHGENETNSRKTVR